MNINQFKKHKFMKKLFFAIIAVCAINFTQAQENVVKANPIGLAFGIANVGYEFAVNDGQSISVAGLYYNRSSIKGLGAGVEYRFYFDGEVIRGWHAGPSVGYFSLEDDFNNSGSIFNVGGEVGHQWIFGKHFAVDVFAGLSYAVSNTNNLDVNSTNIGLGASIGYAW